MKKRGKNSGRARGSGGAADAVGIVSASGGAAVGTSGRVMQPTVSPVGSGRKGLLKNLLGPNSRMRMVRPEHVDAVVDIMACSGSSSQGFASTQSSDITSEPSTSALLKSSKKCDLNVMKESLLLFSDPEDQHSQDRERDCLDFECSDGQQLLPEDVVGRRQERTTNETSQMMVDDDETQIPTPSEFCDVEDVKDCSDDEDCVEDDPRGDDEVLDRTWSPDGDVTGSEDDEVVLLPQSSSRTAGRVTDSSRRQPENADVSMSTPKVSQKKSPAWHFFKQCTNEKTQVICVLCSQILKRGKQVNNLSTSSMRKHLESKHELRWQVYIKSLETGQAPSAAVVATPTTTSSSTTMPYVPHRRDNERVTPSPSAPSASPAPPQSPSHSTPSMSSMQMSIPQIMERKRKYGPSHPRSLSLNESISKLLAFEMLPFRLVETESFRQLMASAVPQYIVPSRHYFSREAVPALHQQVANQIRCALRNAISDKVHITTDTWTSKHGQGRYISLTAHWVNVVAAGPEADRASPHILPSPRIAGHGSLPPVASSSYSATSSSSHSASSSCASSPGQRRSCTTSFSTSRGQRQQAVLKLICLGDKPHTALELWTGIQREMDQWLLPFNLQAGNVVCDNGRNLVAALGRAGLKHIPCLAHVLNLVVHAFLARYPEVPELLSKARLVCAHFRRSHPAAARLSALQRKFHLPAHRLICDVATRWNSTLHMLERLCEQQQAIVQFQLETARISRSEEQRHFTANDWAIMRDLCGVLNCFQFATNMVSADDAIVSCTIPILCLLQKTLQAMIEASMMVAEEGEEVETDPVSGQPTQGFPRGMLQEQGTCTPLSGQGTDSEEQEEEEEEEFDSHAGVTRPTSRVTLERGWDDYQEAEEETDYSEESSSLSIGSLPHMSAHMLRCLRSDSRVVRMLHSAEYWVATLLDPRYKDSLPSFLPPLERERKMRDYKRTVVEALLAEFPSSPEGSAAARGVRGGGSKQCSRGARTTTGGRVTMDSIWSSMFNAPPEHPCPTGPGHVTRKQSFYRMVEDYVSTSIHVLQDGASPFNFWVGKLNVWPELALYALQVLACPAASVLSERVFSTAGGVITDTRIRLSTENVDILTFIKMNQRWIPQDVKIPAP